MQSRFRAALVCGGRVVWLTVACVVLLRASGQETVSLDETSECSERPGVQWRPAIEEALLFNVIQNGFRAATQDYTQSRLGGKFFSDWGRSIGNLHGWSDGDAFFTNYVLHPMQGSINGFIFVQNDRKYRCAEFGRNREYWKSRARATLFAFAASEALELGPISEASIGNAQQYYPQWGLVDHVITPTVGLAWMIGEDFMDKYVVANLENRTRRMWARALVRSTLNPARSMANLMAFRRPWYRDTRSNQLSEPVLPRSSRVAVMNDPMTTSALPMFELAPGFTFRQLNVGHAGSLSCVGGGVTGTLNVNRWFGISADVNGCKMLSPGRNMSGDFLSYVAGPRFTYRNSSQWNPYVEGLLGGAKLTVETVNPALRPAKTSGIPEIDLPLFHQRYTSEAQTNSFALKLGAGVDRILNDAFAVQLIQIEDVHLWAQTLNGRHYANNLAVTTGVVVRFGSW